MVFVGSVVDQQRTVCVAVCPLEKVLVVLVVVEVGLHHQHHRHYALPGWSVLHNSTCSICLLVSVACCFFCTDLFLACCC